MNTIGIDNTKHHHSKKVSYPGSSPQSTYVDNGNIVIPPLMQPPHLPENQTMIIVERETQRS